MTRIRGITTGLAVAAMVALAGCSFPKTSQDKAEWFFGEGKEAILDSLEDQGVSGDRLGRVKGVIAEHKPEVVADLAEAFGQHQESFKTLYAGQDTDTLLSSQAGFDDAQRQALRSIGAMHAAIEEAVGAETWAAANDQRRKHFEEKFAD